MDEIIFRLHHNQIIFVPDPEFQTTVRTFDRKICCACRRPDAQNMAIRLRMIVFMFNKDTNGTANLNERGPLVVPVRLTPFAASSGIKPFLPDPENLG